MRVGNRLAGLLLGLALLAAGLLAALTAALTLAGRRPWPLRTDRWYPALTTTPLRDPLVLTLAIAAAVLGLAVLFFQLRRWPPSRLSLTPAGSGGTAGEWWIGRRSAEHRLAAVDAVSGVRDGRVTLRGKAARWKVSVVARGRDEVRTAVEAAVRAELGRLAAPEPHHLRLAVRPPKRVA